MDFITILFVSAIFGTVAALIGKSKGINGFWYGFFLGIIGIIIVLCMKRKENQPSTSKVITNTEFLSTENKYETLEKLHDLKSTGAITEEEFNTEKNKIIGG